MAICKLPGLIDIHVHLRDLDSSHKEDFRTGTAAALAGGVVAVLDMPNTIPPTVNRKTLHQKAKIASEKALCDFGLYLGATSENAAECAELSHHVAGLKIYFSETYGPLRLEKLPSLMSHFRKWPAEKPLAVHAEGFSMAAVIALAQVYDRSVHICHVSKKAEIQLIREAKEKGVKITCEVTPHHLFLTQADEERLGSLAFMKPSLGTEEDRAALWDNLPVVDVIASDHAPHTLVEKGSSDAPPGVPGLETTLPLLLTAVAEGRLSLQRLVELMHTNPVRIYRLRTFEDSWVEVDLKARYTLTNAMLKTKCGWTPFEGMKVQGRIQRVYLHGVEAYADGKVMVSPGFGRSLF